MNTQVNKPAPAAVVEAKTGRRCYTYIISVSGRLWSLCAREWWGTPEGMLQNAASMATAARIFRHTAAVAVYELRDDDYYYYVHGRQMPQENDAPRTFHRYDFPVIRRQSI